jgi:hypothetical protein
MAKLYELVADLQSFIEQNEGLEDEQIYKDTLEGLQGEIDDKIEQWNRAIKNQEAERDALKSEYQRLYDRDKAQDAQVSRMKDTLLMYLRAMGRKEGGKVLMAKIVKNGGAQPLELLCQPEELPKAFRKIKIEADNTAIRDALASGKKLKFARLLERGEHIKVG